LNAIEAAADLLARARAGQALPGLPEALRPQSLGQAEAVQNATLAAMREGVGGWKVGRHDGVVFSAPIPASRVLAAPVHSPITLPAERYIELELALSFRQSVSPADVATLILGDLTALTTVATLFEFVQGRFLPDAVTGPLDRIADCVANDGAMVRATLMPWTLEMLDLPPAVTLMQDGAVLSQRSGPHVAMPVVPLLEAWIARIRQEGRGIAAGEVVTLGSLSGMPPIPASGASYLGEIEGLEPLRCTVLPVT
jgi:2-keto-4-pentenoate hydratase